MPFLIYFVQVTTTETFEEFEGDVPHSHASQVSPSSDCGDHTVV
jgi:hypothetical protein